MASYFAPNGHYANANEFFLAAGFDNEPIRLLKNEAIEPNGVFAYSATSKFPTSTHLATNYWVDVVFLTEWDGINSPPIVTVPENQTSAEGDVVSLQVEASDPDLDALAYGATGLPAGLSIDQNTMKIVGTLAAGSVGIHNVVLTVSDGQVSTDTNFIWTVTKVSNVIGDSNGPTVSKNEFKWKLTNNGTDDVFVTMVEALWPNQQGTLKELKFGGAKFGDKLNATPTQATFTLPDFVPDVNKRKIAAGATEEFKMKFEKNYDNDTTADYSVRVTFDTGDFVVLN